MSLIEQNNTVTVVFHTNSWSVQNLQECVRFCACLCFVKLETKVSIFLMRMLWRVLRIVFYGELIHFGHGVLKNSLGIATSTYSHSIEEGDGLSLSTNIV